MEKALAPTVSRQRSLDRFFWVLAAAGLVLFAVVTVPPGASRNRALARDLQRASAIHAGLSYKQRAYTQYERALKTDPFFCEAVLRARMKYTRPGENVIPMAAQGDAFTPVDVPKVPDFVPSRPSPPPLRAQIANWAVLLTSALLLAAAFIFFDRPAAIFHRRVKLTAQE
jgi:hypothetical protein